jgi:hypothetical protein
VTDLDPRAFLDAVMRTFQEEGWKDADDAAAAITIAAATSPGRRFSDVDVRQATPTDFLERNGIDAGRLERSLHRTLGDTRVAPEIESFEVLPIDAIDSFSVATRVDPREVASFSAPLKVNERVIKHCIHHLIGDPYVDTDWGGERSDIESARVEVAGERVASAFLLKGQSVTGPLYGSTLGTRGDQIIRLLEQRAQLSIIQHVHTIPGETVDQLRYGVIALRATGAVASAQCSVWDGVDTARLLLASGYIDADGSLTAAGNAANEELGRGT